MLSTLFTNLREHTIAAKGVDFTEELIPFDSLGELRDGENQLFLSSFQELLNFSEAVDFAKGEARTCKKGYPCGASCINAGYNCKKGIAGQAKTYAEFLTLQSKQPKKSVEKPLDKKDKNLSSSFESVDDPQEVANLLNDLTKSKLYEAGEVWQDVLFARGTKDPEWIKDAEDRFSEFGITFNASESQLDDAQSIMLSIAASGARQVQALPDSKRDELVRVIKSNGEVASAVVYRKDPDEILVEYLATSLKNLTTDGGVKGAGTEAIATLVEESIKSGSGGRLRLYPLDGAISFYEKIGFKGYYDKNGEYSDAEMTLEPEAAKLFLKKVRG
jgi:hypothetical protein